MRYPHADMETMEWVEINLLREGLYLPETKVG